MGSSLGVGLDASATWITFQSGDKGWGRTEGFNGDLDFLVDKKNDTTSYGWGYFGPL